MGRGKLLLSAGALTVLLVSLSSCATDRNSGWPGQAEAGRALLPGVVYDMEDQPCPQVEVRLFRRGAGRPFRGTVTDIHGWFYFDGLKSGEYRLVFAKERMETGDITFVFGESSRFVYVKLFSRQDLLDKAEEALDQGELEKAGEYILRLYTVSDFDAPLLFLHGVLKKMQGEDEAARDLIVRAAGAEGLDLPGGGAREE